MTDEAMIQISVEVPVEAITAALEEEGYLPSDDNISTVAEALGNKWMTDISELNELDFILECSADDLEPDPGNYKAHRDWRSRQGAPPSD